jgi:chemotaxis protein methyltransferase CheR
VTSPLAGDEQEWLAFRAQLERAVGVPLGAYKEPQMKRRLASLMARKSLSTWWAFAAAISADPELLREVRETLTINVSEFFRQPERFEELRTVHIPRLLEDRARLRFWSAGCSIGCEPYTVAMILDELGERSPHRILATDLDVPALAQAQRGDGYNPAEIRNVPVATLERFLTRAGDTFAVAPQLKRRITFRRHDLLSDPYPANLDVILCRNVAIYFTPQAKEHVFAAFVAALRPGGLLFVGGSEMVTRPRDYGLRQAGISLYERAA